MSYKTYNSKYTELKTHPSKNDERFLERLRELKEDFVWLNRNQIAVLFDRDVKTIGKHINNALQEELTDLPTVAKFAIVQKEGKSGS